MTNTIKAYYSRQDDQCLVNSIVRKLRDIKELESALYFDEAKKDKKDILEIAKIWLIRKYPKFNTFESKLQRKLLNEFLEQIK